jgi:hypothetical protein
MNVYGMKIAYDYLTAEAEVAMQCWQRTGGASAFCMTTHDKIR